MQVPSRQGLTMAHQTHQTQLRQLMKPGRVRNASPPSATHLGSSYHSSDTPQLTAAHATAWSAQRYGGACSRGMVSWVSHR